MNKTHDLLIPFVTPYSRLFLEKPTHLASREICQVLRNLKCNITVFIKTLICPLSLQDESSPGTPDANSLRHIFTSCFY